MLLLFGAVVFISGTDPKKLKDFIIKTINQANFKFMEKKILYHIGLYGFRKLIVYVIKDNGDNISIVSLNKDGSFPNTFGTVICIT